VPLKDLAPVDAAPLTDAGLTPYHAVKRSLHLLGPASTAVVIGVGGLGHLALQILRAMTATQVIAVDQRPEALELARSSGAHHAVQSGDHAVEEIRDLTHGLGADVVLDIVGADATLALAAAVSRSLGHVTCVGIAGGTFPFSFFSLPYEVSLATTYWGSRSELMEVLALAEAGHLRPETHHFSLADAPDAYRQLHEGRLTGRAVIVP
jgi:propanol-preferring alcohol dehydrogenase